jgi:hypothetical protein
VCWIQPALQAALVSLDTLPELELLDGYFHDRSYVAGHTLSGLDARLFRSVQGAWICTKGVERLTSLARWVRHIDARLGERTEPQPDIESVTIQHVVQAINKDMQKSNSECVSRYSAFIHLSTVKTFPMASSLSDFTQT